jgi:hypothetical protein
MFCNTCKAENPDYAHVCWNCGRSFLHEPITSTMLCLFCRTYNPYYANFCAQCGRPVQREEGTPVADVFIPPPPGSSIPGVPSVQGTPQAGGVPMVQGTSPTHLNPYTGHDAFLSAQKESASQHILHASNAQHALSPQPGHLSSVSQQPIPSSFLPKATSPQLDPYTPAYQHPAPSDIPPKANWHQQLASKTSPASKKFTSPQLAASGGSAVKTIIIVAATAVVVAAGGIGAAAYVLSRPQPLISIMSNYRVGNMLAGASGTILHISGQKFSSNSAITFLLDGHGAPGNPGTRSDANGNFQADLMITNGWGVGTHTLTAKDASNYSTQKGVTVMIVPQGQANTPGPMGAPPDDASFRVNAQIKGQTTTGNQINAQETEVVTGHPDPIGGTVCQTEDNGQPNVSTGITTNSHTPYRETSTFSCSGSYLNE